VGEEGVSNPPTGAVTLPNIGVPLYIGVPHRVPYPYKGEGGGAPGKEGIDSRRGVIAMLALGDDACAGFRLQG